MNSKLRELPINDRLSQYHEQLLSNVTDDVKMRRLEKIKKCNHLFVLLEQNGNVSDVCSLNSEYVHNPIECVRCGLTNKFMSYENSAVTSFDSGCFGVQESLESQLFKEVLVNGDNISVDGIKLISEKPINTNHAGLLFKVACIILSNINPNATVDDIYQIMVELDKLETKEERIKLKNIQDSKNLINRYFDIKRKKTLSKIRKR